MSLTNKVREFNEEIVPIARQIVHGDADTSVMTDNGLVDSFAKVLKRLAEAPAFPASKVTVAPVAGLAATDVQKAIAELVAGKASGAQVDQAATAVFNAAKEYADNLAREGAGVDDAIAAGEKTRAPSQDAVLKALEGKADANNPTFSGTVNGITKDMVGLGNVNNTRDEDKPISAPQKTALDLKADKAAVYTKAEVDAKTATTAKTGDVVTTARAMARPDWLPLDGSTYLQTSYPDLFALLGTAFEPAKLANPATLPTGDANDVAYSGDGVYMAVAHANTPFITTYKRSADVYTKLANPATLPGVEANAVAFTTDGVYLAVALTAAPYLALYKRNGDVFTRLAAPAVLPTSNVNCLDFSPDGSYLAVGCQNSGGTTLMNYKRTADVFALLAAPDVQVPTNCRGVAFSPDGQHLATAPGSSGAIVYKRNGDAFVKTSNPAFLSTSTECVAYTQDGTYLVIGGAYPTALQFYKRSGDVYTKLADPATMPNSNVVSVSFSSDGSTLAATQTLATPYVLMYKRDGDVFTRLPDPPAQPAASTYGVTFSPDGGHLAAAHNNSPYVTLYGRSYDQTTQFLVPAYQPPSTKLKNYIKT